MLEALTVLRGNGFIQCLIFARRFFGVDCIEFSGEIGNGKKGNGEKNKSYEVKPEPTVIRGMAPVIFIVCGFRKTRSRLIRDFSCMLIV
jgi:hypothetical protein